MREPTFKNDEQRPSVEETVSTRSLLLSNLHLAIKSRAIMPSRNRKKLKTVDSKPIPGLSVSAFEKGSRHSAPTPSLVKANIQDNDDVVDFEWRAKGTLGEYVITARGKLTYGPNHCGDLVYSGLKVVCSCPDGERQNVASMERTRIVVCKHAAAALQSVLDPTAGEKEKITQEEFKAKEQERQSVLVAVIDEQERLMPGERERISYGLDALTPAELKNLLKKSLDMVAGLRELVKIFPESVMPVPNTKNCVRCHKAYDERYASQRICRVRHPMDMVRTEWEGSKVSWNHCERCDKEFGPKAPYDEGEWCFEGEHTQDEELVQDEAWDE